MLSGTDRSKHILSRARMILGTADDTMVQSEQIFLIASEKQREIAEEYNVIESSMTLPIVSGTTNYDLTTSSGNPTGFNRLKLLAPPLTSRSIIYELDVNEMDFYQRYTRVSTGLPIWYIKIFQGMLSFFPTPTATENWTVYFYKSPTTTISKTVGPETPSAFDTALVFGAVAELAPSLGKPELAQLYLPMYEQEIEKGIGRYRGTRTEMKQITYRDI